MQTNGSFTSIAYQDGMILYSLNGFTMPALRNDGFMKWGTALGLPMYRFWGTPGRKRWEDKYRHAVLRAYLRYLNDLPFPPEDGEMSDREHQIAKDNFGAILTAAERRKRDAYYEDAHYMKQLSRN